MDVIFNELMGVVGVIMLWNFLMVIVFWVIVLVLVVGNVVLVKFVELMLLIMMWFGELVVEVGLDEDLL